MKKHFLCIALAFYGVVACGQGPAVVQSGDWEVRVAPYLLMGSVSGEAAIGVTGPSEVDLDFGDILEKLQVAFMVHGEVYKGDWGAILDYTYLKLGDDIATEQAGVIDITQKQAIFEAFLSRRFRKEWGWFDVFGGIRHWDNKYKLELDGFQVSSVSFNADWVDPVIGGRIYYNITDRFLAGFRGDIGGFGAGSDLTYTLQPGIGYHISDWFTLMLQYKYLYADYDNGKEGRDLYSYDAATNGPLLGLLFRF